MDQLNQVINSLSNEELDLLNSDPQMLKAFRAKYSQPEASNPITGAMMAGLQAAMPSQEAMSPLMPSNPDASFMGAIKGGAETALQTLHDPTRISPTISLPGQVAAEKLGQTEVGRATNNALENVGVPEGVTKFVESSALDPQSYIGVGVHPEAGGLEGELGSFVENLKKDSSLAKFNKKLLGVSESATKMGGQHLPSASQGEIDSAVENVIKAHEKVVGEHGKALNEAKASVGLPVTQEEKDASIRKFGNQRGLDIGQPLELHPDAPKVLNPDESITVSGKDVPEQALTYRGPAVNDSEEWLKSQGFNDEVISKLKQPIFDTTTPIGDRPAKTTLSVDELRKLGYDMPDVTKGAMPYKITPTKTAEDLNTEISRFIQNQKFISNKDRVRAATYYQDKIKNFVPNFAQEGDEMQGLLKGKYQQLKGVIGESSPELAKAKKNFANVKQALSLVSENLDEKRPGKTQDFLRRIFTSNTEAANDTRKQLAALEQLTGQPVISDLFKKFAGREFSQYVGPKGERLMKYAVASPVAGLLLGHPGIGAGVAATEIGMTSPKLMGGLEHLASKLPSKLPAIGVQAAKIGLTNKAFNTPELQSLRDRLRNSESK